MNKAFLFILFLPTAPMAAPAAPSPLTVTIRIEKPAGAVTNLHVSEVWQPAPGTPLHWSIARHLPGLRHLAESVSAMHAADDAGPLELAVADMDAPSGPVRRWTPKRPVRDTVHVTYDLSPQPVSEAGGPPIGMMAAGGGIAGGTSGLLALPDSDGTFNVTLDADVTQLPEGSVATSSKGELPVTGVMTVDDLQGIWLLFGPARHTPVTPAYAGYELGHTPPEAGDLLNYGERAYDALSDAFGYKGRPRYRVLLRALDGVSPATGTSEDGGALVTLGSAFRDDQKGDYIHDVLFHEMAHNWIGHMTPNERWFSEGLATYTANVLRCEHGLDPWTHCAAQLTEKTGWALASPGRAWSMDALAKAPFDAESLRRVPYGRGVLYFATLDAGIRAKSRGKRTLLGALAPLFVARDEGHPITRAVWEAWLSRELGPLAVDTFHAVIIDGSAQWVPKTAFPACLHRTRIRVKAAGTDAFADSYLWTANPECKEAASPAAPDSDGIATPGDTGHTVTHG